MSQSVDDPSGPSVGRRAAGTHAQLPGEALPPWRGLGAHLCRLVEDQAATGTQRVADRLRRLGKEGLALADGRTMEAPAVGDYLRQAAQILIDAADHVHDLADDVQSWGAGSVLEELEGLARRRRGVILVGTAVAGLAAAQIVRAVCDRGQQRANQNDHRRSGDLGSAALDALLRSIWSGDSDEPPYDPDAGL